MTANPLANFDIIDLCVDFLDTTLGKTDSLGSTSLDTELALGN
jgi:hypothetical protein